MFPVDRVPDGAIFAPHHAYLGTGVVALVLATMWNDSTREPWAAAAALVAVVFSFATVWPFYPEVGAAVALLGVGALAVAPARDYWRPKTRTLLAAYYVGVLIVADDVLEHALGVWTPLDAFWNVLLHPLVEWIGAVV